MDEVNVSQSEIARRMGVTPSYVSQILSGHRRPGLDTLEAVADALGCDPAELIAAEEKIESCA
jgi:transcriptional regulator with XRE-family HTH domain